MAAQELDETHPAKIFAEQLEPLAGSGSIRLSDIEPTPDLEPTAPPPAEPIASVTSPVQPPSGPTRTTSKKSDPFQLQVDLAESAFALKPDYSSLSRLTAILERGISLFCHSSRGERSIRIARCEAVKARLLELDAANLPAVCESFGLMSAECREVFEAQQIGWYDVDSGSWSNLLETVVGKLEASDLQNAIEVQRRKPAVLELAKKINTLRNSPAARVPTKSGQMNNKQAVVDQVGAELDQALLQGLELTCGSPKLLILPPERIVLSASSSPPLTGRGHELLAQRVEPYSPPASVSADSHMSINGAQGQSPSTANGGGVNRATEAENIAPGGSLSTVLEGLRALPTIPGASTATAVQNMRQISATQTSRIQIPAEQRYRRIRLLSRDCLEIARVALDSRPGLRQGLCARDGWYAPTCRLATKQAEMKQDGMSSF